MVSGSWSARVRDRDLMLGEDIRFTTATRVRNYNRPSALAVTGRLANLRPLLQPGSGIYVADDRGVQQFSGMATGIRRVGAGNRAELMFTSDLVHLWWRLCWPKPAAPWAFQTDPYDVQTATTETRILGYVNRNAGPLAWRAPTTGTDPGTGGTFSAYATLVPSRKIAVQVAVVDDANGDLFTAQSNDADSDESTPDTLYISHWVGGVERSTMTFPKGGHGDQLLISRVKGKVYCTFRYRGLSGSHDVSGTWVRVPYVAGKTWTATQALAYKVAAPIFYRAGTKAQPIAPFRTNPLRASWWQGEAFYDGTFYRLYGTPYNASGPTGSNPDMPARIEVIKNGVITRTIDASALGRDVGGVPIDGRLEPEGLSIITVAGQPCLLVGVMTGSSTTNTFQHRLYTFPLKPSTETRDDRRVPNLRIPTTLSRGSSAKTSARFEVLGQLVADLAELDDLSVDVALTYEAGVPHLDLVVGDAPDLTDSIRAGTAEQGGPLVIGEDWFYNLELPPDTAVTTALSAAGGEGAARILTSSTDYATEALWGVRVERLVDQRDTTDTTSIAEGLASALLDGAGTAEVSIPLGRSSIGLGTEVPLGAKISALLDGELITERIRQITTVVQNASGEPTVKTTAVLGSPDAGVKSPTQKRLAAMLRRVQRLEAR